LGPVAEDAVIYALAVAESNAAMGRIVAAPTAGASGVLPGVLFALKKHGKLYGVDLEKALVVAGSIGQVIASRASWLAPPVAARRSVAARQPWLPEPPCIFWEAAARRSAWPFPSSLKIFWAWCATR
jgi:hypothetical protein